MQYTITQVAKMSKISVRTLRFYDEIDLFKPTAYSASNYRYYHASQLLILQQILFYRHLGFPLKTIKEIITQPNFNILQSLKDHKKQLTAQAKNITDLIATIDNTIQHLQGKKTMKNNELYKGFDPKKQETYESYISKTYKDGDRLIRESQKSTSTWNKEDWDAYHKRSDAIYSKLTELMRKKYQPETTEVQTTIAQHFQLIHLFYTPTLEMYAHLGDLYINHPDFKKFFDVYDANLATFLAKAMLVYSTTI